MLRPSRTSNVRRKAKWPGWFSRREGPYDARNESAVKILMDNRVAAVIFTDPPFNVKIDGNVSGKGAVKHSDFAMAVGEMSAAEFSQFLEVTLGHLARHSSNVAVHFVCMDFRHLREILDAGGRVTTPC